MSRFYVYYSDDYEDVGLEVFDTERKALAFIDDRRKQARFPSIDRYQLIEGRELVLEDVEVVTRTGVKR